MATRSLFLVPALLAAAPTLLAQQAVVTPIPGLPSAINTPNSSAAGINNAGHILGLTDLYGFDPASGTSYPGVAHSFLSLSPASATDIGVLGTDPPPFVFPRAENFATHINSVDQVAAFGENAAFFGLVYAEAWLPTPAYGFPAGLIQLPSLTTPDIDRAWGMNDSGVVVGETRDAANNVRAARWTLQNGAATIIDIAPALGPNARAMAVNNLGQIVGQANEPNPIPFDNFFQSFLYLPDPAYGLPSGITVLQAPGVESALNFGFPNCINENGQTFGRTGGLGWHPALWLPAPALGLPAGVTLFNGQVFPDETFIRLGSIGLGNAEFNAANLSGVAVGDAGFIRVIQFPRPRQIIEGHAFIWRNGRFQLLEDFLPLGSPWTRIYTATGINDAGVITANAQDNTGHFYAIKITLDGPSCPSGIIHQPQGTTACAGDTVTLTMVANGGGGGDLSYVWRRNGEAISDGPAPGGGTIVGASTLQLQIVGAGPADGGNYDVQATNSCGTLTSNPASVTVNPLPTFATNPTDAHACFSGSATFTATADDPNAGYGWLVEDPFIPGSFISVDEGTNFLGDLTFEASGSFTNTLVVSTFQNAAGGNTSTRFECQAFTICAGPSTPATLSITQCGCSADFNCDGDIGTDADIASFFGCLSGSCPAAPCANNADFNGDGDVGTDADIESFFRVLAGGPC
jgi:hypothetical protein